ncbi:MULTISPECIES: DUF1840 domain-containing protein [unclassified Bordetella]|uniref:DUF1840 domain-containing protein n=1 Tax=unclassified Bordetella TaxID=2630031 RepID=UPI00132115B0|nr:MULTISPECIES: DUF1840 domain-containing protein [unclassified Bordetella]MVW72906.1 DUF1840 family protein [Bordetella sp. 15P40C-2]MVW78714.1 DUF1840 family protein [Bordetella sp. 02P26C-1]
MLIKFRSKTVAEVLMLSANAAPLLRAAGKTVADDVPERGVFTVEQLPAAIAGIEAAIKAEEAHRPAQPSEEEDDAAPVPPMAQHVELHQRAFPLLDMMRRSLQDGEDVTWESTKGW